MEQKSFAEIHVSSQGPDSALWQSTHIPIGMPGHPNGLGMHPQPVSTHPNVLQGKSESIAGTDSWLRARGRRDNLFRLPADVISLSRVEAGLVLFRLGNRAGRGKKKWTIAAELSLCLQR